MGRIGKSFGTHRATFALFLLVGGAGLCAACRQTGPGRSPAAARQDLEPGPVRVKVLADGAFGGVEIPGRLPDEGGPDEVVVLAKFFPGGGPGPTYLVERHGGTFRLAVHPADAPDRPSRSALPTDRGQALLRAIARERVDALGHGEQQGWDGVEYFYAHVDRRSAHAATRNNPGTADAAFLRFLRAFERAVATDIHPWTDGQAAVAPKEDP